MREFLRRLLPSQLFVAATLIGAALIGHAPWPVLVVLGVILEVGSLLGALLGGLLKRRRVPPPPATLSDDLPLSRRR